MRLIKAAKDVCHEIRQSRDNGMSDINLVADPLALQQITAKVGAIEYFMIKAKSSMNSMQVHKRPTAAALSPTFQDQTASPRQSTAYNL